MTLPVWVQTLLVGLTVFTMFVGLIGLIVPIFPGNVVIWLAALVYGLITGFGTLGGWMFALISISMIAAVLLDNILMGAKARSSGAAWSSIVIALISGIVGTIVMPPIGGLLAAPLLLYGFEYIRLKDSEKAIKITRGLMLGWGQSYIVRFVIGLVMIALWGIWAFLG